MSQPGSDVASERHGPETIAAHQRRLQTGGRTESDTEPMASIALHEAQNKSELQAKNAAEKAARRQARAAEKAVRDTCIRKKQEAKVFLQNQAKLQFDSRQQFLAALNAHHVQTNQRLQNQFWLQHEQQLGAVRQNAIGPAQAAGGAAGALGVSTDQWKSQVIAVLMENSTEALKHLSSCRGLGWFDSTQRLACSGRLNFGRVQVADGGAPSQPHELTIVLRNMNPEAVLITELTFLPDSGRFEWQYAMGGGLGPPSVPCGRAGKKTGEGGIEGEGDRPGAGAAKARRVYHKLKQKVLPLRLDGNSEATLRVLFRPTQQPGFYDQWLLARFEVARQCQSDSVFSFLTENVVLGLVASASCLANADAFVLLNAEAPPFIPLWLRNLFAIEQVVCAGHATSGSMGTSEPRPALYPRQVCGFCQQDAWEPLLFIDKEQRSKMQWDGGVHSFPPCGHLYHSRCLSAMMAELAPREAMLACRKCGARASQQDKSLQALYQRTWEALARRNRPSLNTNNSLYLAVARGVGEGGGKGGGGGPGRGSPDPLDMYQQRFRALLDAEEEQIEMDLRNYDMFEVNRSPGKGVLSKDGKPRLLSCRTAAAAARAQGAAPEPESEALLFLELEVPGLIERRPAVVYGDALRLRFTAFRESVLPFEYVGFVHAVRRTTVRLCVPPAVGALLTKPALNYVESLRFALVRAGNHAGLAALNASLASLSLSGAGDGAAAACGGVADVRWHEPLWMHVRFASVKYQSSFTRLRATLDGLQNLPHLHRLIFPASAPLPLVPPEPQGAPQQHPGLDSASPKGLDHRPKVSTLRDLTPQDVHRCAPASLNAEQRVALERMLTTSVCEDKALLLFGPPGTGKTLTLVEGVLLAIALGGASTRVLCCAPSDSAADVIVQRLHLASKTFRLPSAPQNGIQGAPSPPSLPWDAPKASVSGVSGHGEQVVGDVDEASQREAYMSTGESGRKWMLRLNPYTRDIESVRPEVVPFSATLDAKSQRFVVPEADELRSFPVIVTTCASSFLLQERGMPAGHFDLIVVDEAAQALEPETLMPLALKGPDTRVILAGDWKQLGPVVRSRHADALGLGKSLLERLANEPLYRQPDCPWLVKLLRNYRSHEELLQLSSELFYDDSLVAAADEATTHSLLGVACRIADAPERAWMQNGQLATGEDSFEDGYALDSSEAVVENEEGDEGKEGEKSGKSRTGRRNCGEKGGMPGDRMLPVPEDPKAGAWHRTEEDQARGWNERAEQQQQQQGLEEEVEVSVSRSTPLLFYGVEGRDMSEDDSASFYNPAEAATVRTLIQRLLACADYGISTNEIGVIAPYRKQVQKIRLLLRKEELGAVRVGTVDDYQGQEEKIIIISTTLSNSERLNSEGDNSLGFLSNERRFNVAITRATSLCIIVGNPFVMLAKPHWKTLLQHCVNRQAYAGCIGPLEPRLSDDLNDELFDEDAQLEHLNHLASEYLLGSGDVPHKTAQVMETYYRDELEFRVVL